MIVLRRLGTSAMFATMFLLAGLLGRLTVVPETALALVWPAAGVAAVWFATTGWTRWLAVDVAVLFVSSWAVNDATGADTHLALALAAAALVQALALGVLLSRWSPHLWGPHASGEGLTRFVDVGRLLAAATLASTVSAIFGPASALSVTDSDGLILGSWVVRNAAGIVVLFPLGLMALDWWQQRGVGQTSGRDRGQAVSAELLALAIVSGATCWLVFAVNRDLPVPFLLLGMSVWAGSRFPPAVAASHTVLLGAAVVGLTLHGLGPFSTIADGAQQALVVQAYLGLAALLALALSVGRLEATALTVRLTGSEREATSRAAMVRAILDSMADGVTVVDSDGQVVLRNPAASQLLGDLAEDRLEAVVPSTYGLLHPDGTPVGHAEMPLARALGGERIVDADFFVRNPTVPDGRLLQVSATPLPDTEPPSAVVVFHDVTAERRERDELASFAGVVAHDLLNPLTTVEGWSEALADELSAPEPPDPDLQMHHLDRIQRAARRMRDLINDLLAYTTARDLKINPVPVDLTAMVEDVARGRAEASRVKGGEAPVITVGCLPAVLAEPVLLRQVVDNLLGNSVKYVAPGVRPEIDVTAHRDEHLVVLEFHDNGIGIPAGQHARVFDTFHRAHAEGYRGTGLGLSIVKRIVERHGGSITASDNPGTGGTTMRLTLPAAATGEG